MHPTLPTPITRRFQPLRSGLINLFKYQDQEFWYEHGRLLIRGNNGTGKSRVLALQLPFLFDGEIAPWRVEPDGDPARQIAWHLLMGDDYEQRTGYTWIEFGRLDENGTEHYLTLGCGMRAIRGGDNQPTRWYFITDRRIRRDFELVPNAHPLSADSLEEKVGEKNFFKSPREYRLEIDKRLFGIGTERYESLINLLIRLRAPQLAKKLNADLLYTALSDALPPLPANVVDKVASAFKDLDHLRSQYANLQKLATALGQFHADYQSYLQAALYRRADVVRQRHNEFELAQRHANKIEEELATAKNIEADAEAAHVNATNAFTIADAHLASLQSTSGAEDAKTLELAKQNAESAQKLADNTAATAQAALQRQQTIDTEIEAHSAKHAEHVAALGSASSAAAQHATPASFESEHARHIPAPAAWPADTARIAKLKNAHTRAAETHLQRLKQIDSLLDGLSTKQTELQGAQNAEDTLAAAITTQDENASAHDQSAQNAMRQLGENYTAWQGALRRHTAPHWSELASAFEDWLETDNTIHRVLPATLSDIARHETEARATAAAQLKTKSDQLNADRNILLAEQTSLQISPPPPVAPTTRDSAARAHRPGAPLWQACEFHPNLTSAQRAGLEAALEAAGLLDAWISPDGALSSPDMPADTFIASTHANQSTALASSQTLARWLKTDPTAIASGALTDTAIQTALQHIAAGPSNTPHWVALDGRWQLGPAFGRGQKSASVHLGAASREAARLRRLAEIAQALAHLDTRQSTFDTEAAELETRAAEAAAELKRAPDDELIARALANRTEARKQLDTIKTQHAAAAQKTNRARQARDTAQTKLNYDARDLGYGNHLHRLSELKNSWHPYAQAMAELWAAAQTWATSANTAEALANKKCPIDEELATATKEASAAKTEALTANENHRTLAATLGTSVAEYQELLSTARIARQEKQSAVTNAHTHWIDAGKARVALEARLGPAQETITAASATRQTAIDELRVPLLHNLFPEAHHGLADIEQTDWSPTRAYAIARRILKDLPEANLTPAAWTDRLNLLNTQVNDLSTLVGALGCQVVSRMLGEGLTIVTCRYQGTPLTPALCLAAAITERDTHERLLSEREQAIIHQHLVAEVSQQLQHLIENARKRTDEMNSEMERCATTLGLKLRLVWQPLTENIPAGLPQIRKLLLADHNAWSEAERLAVGEFLRQLINEERARNPAAPASEQLLNALDYRRWHAYAAERYQNNKWERLTKKLYGTGSGGEKALMLTIPQMAAASSHYKYTAPHAPRFILLDEAFAGMDKPTRARCMGMLEAFDLDLLMTSEREWGAHATISGIAIYQLVADTEAIAATRWVWNGKQTKLAPVPDTPELRKPENS